MEDQKLNTRPTDWSWDNTAAAGRAAASGTTIAAGNVINLSANTWNNFTERINAFRRYVGLDGYTFTRAESGMEISAAIVNEARVAIGGISRAGTVPGAAQKDGLVRASFFNGLMEALNATP